MKTQIKWRKKITMILLYCLTGFAGLPPLLAQVEGQAGLDFPMEDKLMKNAREAVNAYETGNWEVLRENSAKDAFFYNLGSYDSLTLDQTIKYWSRGREIATPVLAEDGVWAGVSIPEGPRTGKWILHWGTNTLRYPNGETISFPYHVALKFEKEKVSQAHFYYDNNRIIRALGYKIQPPLKEQDDGEFASEDDAENR